MVISFLLLAYIQLQMNDDKTEAILFARKGLASEHLPKSIKIDNTAINFVPVLRDLGVTLDSSLSFNQHVMNTCRSAFLELRRIGLIHKYQRQRPQRQLCVL